VLQRLSVNCRAVETNLFKKKLKYQAEVAARQERQEAQERERQEKLKWVKERTVLRISAVVAEGQEQQKDNIFGRDTDVLRFEFDESSGTTIETAETLGYDSRVRGGEGEEESAVEVRPEEVDEMIEMVYKILGAERPAENLWEAQDKSEENGDGVALKYEGQSEAKTAIPGLTVLEFWTRSKHELVSREHKGDFPVGSLPVTQRLITIEIEGRSLTEEEDSPLEQGDVLEYR
jgi:hypothetical protein